MNVSKINQWIWGLCITAVSFIAMSTLLYLFLPEAAAAEPQAGGVSDLPGWEYYMAAALATGMSSIAAGIAVSHVGAAAVAAVSEKPELLGKVLIILGLSEGIAIYGLIVSFVIIAEI
ncbi:ATP synthase subunit C [Psychromonas aquimarina]|uniref:ATP synthase subunit C n=1 Tax=Psychromonas aquimarina TaxID=444919 RepID=UPI000400F372|nr:ATP synthase subunit C [Psychromonas aquimarina]